ncbi:PREDICTED: uncharacterized protein LOC104814380 [Tarenaya hassleriana]|uniref:uncharacterized protein LOC104814380 n=1 Tax=Tarenaya hassleriana TaxID=28532 RepID=UPI00053C2AFA|nr:PREDICTED: uncharacterized protein LOC104814380 [Tarenaya hassleriana]
MADFGFLSDTDDSAVEDLISQAKELSVLEQVAAINCSGLTDSVLPDDLETRFRRLKSMPGPPPDPESSSSKRKKKQFYHSKSAVNYPVRKRGGGSFSSPSSGDEERVFSRNERNPGGKFCDTKNSRAASGSLSSSDEKSRILSGNKRNPGLKKDSRPGLTSDGSGDFSDSGKIGSSSSDSSKESKIFSAAKQTGKLLKGKSRIESASSSIETASSSSIDPDREQRPKPKSSSKSWLNLLLSPSKAIGCMLRSPNKTSNSKTMLKKNSRSFSAYSNRDKAVDFDEFLSDIGTLSVEDQRKTLKKAIKEQQRMRREAAEIIKMAKQTSARFDFDD